MVPCIGAACLRNLFRFLCLFSALLPVLCPPLFLLTSPPSSFPLPTSPLSSLPFSLLTLYPLLLLAHASSSFFSVVSRVCKGLRQTVCCNNMHLHFAKCICSQAVSSTYQQFQAGSRPHHIFSRISPGQTKPPNTVTGARVRGGGVVAEGMWIVRFAQPGQEGGESLDGGLDVRQNPHGPIWCIAANGSTLSSADLTRGVPVQHPVSHRRCLYLTHTWVMALPSGAVGGGMHA